MTLGKGPTSSSLSAAAQASISSFLLSFPLSLASLLRSFFFPSPPPTPDSACPLGPQGGWMDGWRCPRPPSLSSFRSFGSMVSLSLSPSLRPCLAVADFSTSRTAAAVAAAAAAAVGLIFHRETANRGGCAEPRETRGRLGKGRKEGGKRGGRDKEIEVSRSGRPSARQACWRERLRRWWRRRRRRR